MAEVEKDVTREILDRLTRIEVKIDAFETVKDISYCNQKEVILLKADNDTLEKRVSDLEEKNKWMFRSIVGAVIVAVVSIIAIFFKIGMGVA